MPVLRRSGAPTARRASLGSPRVLVVDPYLARDDPMERRFLELYPSLGVLSLAAYLRAASVEVEVCDLTFARDTRPVRRAVRTLQPQVVGVHTKSLTRPRAVEIARIAHAGGALAIAGGPDAATDPVGYLLDGFEAVVRGEGEAVLLDAARRAASGTPLDGTPGLAVASEGGGLRAGPPRPFLKDLDALPMPAWDLVDIEGYLRRWNARTGERRMAVLTSRGCPFDCSWCSKPTFGRTFRQMSAPRVLEELRQLSERYRVDYVRFCDDVFGIHRPWLDQLLDGMEAARLGQGFEVLARVELLRTDLLARMRSLGLARVYVGVESGSQKMLDAMNRGTRLAQIERAAEALRSNGVRQFWFLMLGYPGETLEDIEATLALFRRFSPEEYSVSIAVPIPGTRFYESVKDRLRSFRNPRRVRSAGRALLFRAAYPESVYHWEQARFAWEGALAKARGKVSPNLLARLSEAADDLDRGVVRPILLGTPRTGRARPRPAPAQVRREPGLLGGGT